MFQVAIRGIAEFHGTCFAYDRLNTASISHDDSCSSSNLLVDNYPLINGHNLVWRRPEMMHFLNQTLQAARQFLSVLPDAQDVYRYYSSKMQSLFIQLFYNNLTCKTHVHFYI